jgi:hypothetical protein
MRHEEARSCADRCGEDRDVLRIGKLASSFAVVCRGAMDLHRNSAEELFEERSGLRELGGQIPSYLRHGGLGKHETKEPSSPRTRIGWLAPVRDSRPAIRTSASTQTGSGSLFPSRATQILQGQLSRSTQALHLGGEPWHDEHARAEKHRSIQVDHGQGISFAEPILLS